MAVRYIRSDIKKKKRAHKMSRVLKIRRRPVLRIIRKKVLIIRRKK